MYLPQIYSFDVYIRKSKIYLVTRLANQIDYQTRVKTSSVIQETLKFTPMRLDETQRETILFV